MAYETKLPRQASSSTVTEDFSEDSEVLPPVVQGTEPRASGVLGLPSEPHLRGLALCSPFTLPFRHLGEECAVALQGHSWAGAHCRLRDWLGAS